MERQLYYHKHKGTQRTISVDKEFINIEIYKLEGPIEVDANVYSNLLKSFIDLIELEDHISINNSKYHTYFKLETFNYYLDPGIDMITLYTNNSNLIGKTTRKATEEEIDTLKNFIMSIFYGTTVL